MATRHIVLGLDGSAGSRAALQWCVGMALLLDADVTAVHSLRPLIAYLPQPASGLGAPPNYDARLHEQLALALEEWCAPLRSAGIEYRARVVDGDAAPAIMRVADEVDADLVAVGRRGESGFAELVLGSVPHHLSHHCRRPVVVVPESS